MKIQLPNGEKIILEDEITYEEKIKKVEVLIDTWIVICLKSWHSNSVKYFLDSLSNYLIWHKEIFNDIKEDKEVMSRNKTNRMNKGTKEMPFSCLSNKDRDILFGEVRRDKN